MIRSRTSTTPSRGFGARLIVAVLCMLIVIMPLAQVSAYQVGSESDPYRTELLNWAITVSGPNYVLENVALEEYPHGRGERIYISSLQSLGFVEIALFDDEDSPEDTIELMLRDFEAASQSLEIVDAGFEQEIHFALARFDLGQGLIGYFYIEVAEDISGNVDLAQSIYTLNADFLEQVDIARDEIAMNGFPFLQEPVIDLQQSIDHDSAALASTPVPMPELRQGTHTFETASSELVVSGEIELDFPVTNNSLEVMFLSSHHGYGVVGYIHQESTIAQDVLAGVFMDAPTGAESPTELYLESDEVHAFGVYRVRTAGQTRAMVIDVQQVDHGLWKVQAIATTESEFAAELRNYQQGIEFDGEPLLGDVDEVFIMSILHENRRQGEEPI